MTINKLGISLVAAGLLSTASLFAGTLTVQNSTAGTVAEELLIDNNASLGVVEINATYTPKLNAGVQDGKLMVLFEGASINDDGTIADLHLYNRTQQIEVGKNPTLAGANKEKLIFDVNGSINDADQLFISSDANISLNMPADLNLTMLEGNKTIGMNYALLDNVDDIRDQSTTEKVGESVKEWDIVVKSGFSSQIDAAAGFLKFTDASNTPDTASVDIVQYQVDIGTGDITTNYVLHMDSNVSSFGALTTVDSTGAGVVLVSDGNGSAFTATQLAYVVTEAANTSGLTTHTFSFNPSTVDVISETKFQIDANVSTSDSNANFKKQYLTTADFGEWTIYGYRAQIPGVMGVGIFQTNLKFTNRSTLDTGIYFTLIDQDGTIVNLSSDVDGLAPIPANTTKQYLATDLVALATAKDANFDGAKSFSVEVSIPTTPSKVYGFASFKNTDVGNFKDLPIYNTSTLNY